MSRPDQIARTSTITTYRGGSGVSQEWKGYQGISPNGGSGGGKKKEICGLSRTSRKSLNDFTSKLSGDKLVDEGVYHVVLTVPSEYRYVDHTVRAAWLDSFRSRLQYEYKDKGLAVLVRQELSSKKSYKLNPHYHLLVVLPDVPDRAFREFVSTSWWKSCGRLSEDHLEAGTTTKRIRTRRYFERVRKYIGRKEKIHNTPSGKCWSIWGRRVFEENYIQPEQVIIPDMVGGGGLDKVPTRVRRILGKRARRNLGERYYNSHTYLPYEDARRLLAYYGVYPYLRDPPGEGERVRTYFHTIDRPGLSWLEEELDSRGLDFYDIWPELRPETGEEELH